MTARLNIPASAWEKASVDRATWIDATRQRLDAVLRKGITEARIHVGTGVVPPRLLSLRVYEDADLNAYQPRAGQDVAACSVLGSYELVASEAGAGAVSRQALESAATIAPELAVTSKLPLGSSMDFVVGEILRGQAVSYVREAILPEDAASAAHRRASERLIDAIDVAPHVSKHAFPELLLIKSVVVKVADPSTEIAIDDPICRDHEFELGEELQVPDWGLTREVLREIISLLASEHVTAGSWESFRRAGVLAAWRRELPGIDFDAVEALDGTLVGGAVALFCAACHIMAMGDESEPLRGQLKLAHSALCLWLVGDRSRSLEDIEGEHLWPLEAALEVHVAADRACWDAVTAMSVALLTFGEVTPDYSADSTIIERNKLLDVLTKAIPVLSAHTKRRIGAFIGAAAASPEDANGKAVSDSLWEIFRL